MQHLISDRLQRLAESATLKMSRMARELREEGKDVISLSLGEPDFDTPKHIKEAAKKALDDGFTKYTPVNGLPVLRNAIVEKFKRDNNLDFTADQIVVSTGAKQSIANIMLSLLNEGDEVIILAPFWVSYSEIVKLGSGTPVILKSTIEEDYKVSAEKVKAAITDKTRLVIFSSPCNPTGSVYTQEELEAIAEVIAPHEDIYIVSDEIYEHINFGEQHVSIGTIPSVKERTITVNGFAKGFAMTGWRLGFIGAPKWIASACTKLQGQVTSGANAFSQVAGAYALGADMTPTQEMKAAFLKRRDLMIEGLGKIDGFKVNKPMGAFYIFPNISAFFGKKAGDTVINDADDFCEYILQEAHVAIVTGKAFGADECCRISYAAADDVLKEAIRRIGEACAKIKG